MNELRTAWIQLKRMVGINPATPLESQEGQLRYSRDGSVDGKVYLARRKSGGTYEWEQLNQKQPLDSDLTAIAGLADPNADRILFWDDSAGSYAYLTPGTNLTITGTTIDAAGGAGGTVEVDEGGSKVNDAGIINFDATDFNVSDSPSGTANVSLNYGTGANQPAEGNHTHAYGLPLTINEGGSAVETTVDLINFDATDFNVSNPLNNQVSVTLNYGTSAGTPAEGNHTHALDDLSDVDVASPGAIAGKTPVWDGSSVWNDQWVYCGWIGHWYLNDVPGTASTACGRAYFNTATAVSRSTNPERAGRVAYIVGAKITSDAARTAGTATVKVLLNGASTAFDAGSVVLDGTRTTQDCSIVVPSSGIAVTSGSDTIGVEVVTSGWTPTTADVTVELLVMYSPIG